MSEDADVVVIGLGPGGEDVAGRLASSGLDVVGVERDLVGGECPYWGCVPSKMMIRAADLLAEARRIPGICGAVTVHPDYRPVADRMREEATDNWNDQVAVDRFVGKGGRFVRGQARLDGPGRVQVGETRYTARRAVVIASGTRATIPPIPGLDGSPFWTNRHAIEATEVPASMMVLGGGPVGLELAQVFARFGSAVTIVEAGDRLLAQEEPEAGDLLSRVLCEAAITVRTNAQVSRVSYDGAQFTVQVDGHPLSAERLLVAAGRHADLTSLGLDSVGVDAEQRWLDGDDRLRVREGLWAVGDITGRGAFTHVALYQSAIAARAILDEPGPPATYHAVPRVTFTDPEVGAVGLTERQARAAGRPVRVATTPLASSARGWIHKAGNDGFIKIVEDVEQGILIGATAAGPSGGEVLSLLALAVHAQLPTATLRHMIYAYPTFRRAIADAVAELESSRT